MNLMHLPQKNLLFLIFLVLVRSQSLVAQTLPSVYKLPNLRQASVVIPFNERYQFDAFKKGYVYKFTGARSEAKLNYSYLYGDILFETPEKDTMSIFDIKMVRFVSIGENIYYHDHIYGYAEIIAEHDGLKLGKKRQFMVVDYDKTGSYTRIIDPPVRAGEAALVKVFEHVKPENLTNLTLRESSTYYFIDSNNRFFEADRSNLLKIQSRIRRPLLKFMKGNVIDFKNEDDLKKVISCCGLVNAQP